ncbi:hypothetical protein FAEPRAA2165_01851 [Faecalibacterium duncaniae]|uniref:Uncharacterized protein n=1 Tax=Faecalibacterium duncaniae (strain DSM 17677 / JCM 31915 / A2-165) TaxID=411483 RepID=C7H6B9_FAED2|nr:hypothetical protein FAEPRAA2165_01851 [Faecalibacterium duncaniae]
MKAPSWRELSSECETEGVVQRFSFAGKCKKFIEIKRKVH